MNQIITEDIGACACDPTDLGRPGDPWTQVECHACDGQAGDWACKTCHGLGYVLNLTDDCEHCHGTGVVPERTANTVPCNACCGRGWDYRHDPG